MIHPGYDQRRALSSSSPNFGADAFGTSQLGRRDDTRSRLRVRWLLCNVVLGITVTEVLVAVAICVEVSVAVRVQRPTETMASVPKVAAPSLAVATVVPLRTHEEEMVMISQVRGGTGIDPVFN